MKKSLENARKISAGFTHPASQLSEKSNPLSSLEGKTTTSVVFRDEDMIRNQMFTNKLLNKVEEPKHGTDQHLSKWRGE